MEQDTSLGTARPLLMKQLTWDILPHDARRIRAVQARLGLPPDTCDGAEFEHDRSDIRLGAAVPLEPALELLSGMAAEVFTAYLANILEDDDGDPGITAQAAAAFTAEVTPLVCDSALALIALLLDSGVLAYSQGIL